MTFSIFLFDKANEVLSSLTPDDYNRCVSALKSLCDNPFPGSGGDKEKLRGDGNRYRLHIGRTFSAIYKIDKEKKRVCVTAFGTIGDIHKKY